MPQLTDQQIAEHASNAGFTGQDLETAIAVALAESGGDSDAIGDVALQNEVFGPSVGLWQIRSVNEGHGNSFDQAHRNHQANLDPATNARNAHAIFDRYGWGQWSTHQNGDYRQFLDRARRARPAQNPATPGTQGSNGSNPHGFMTELAKLIDAIGKLANPADKLGRIAQVAGQAVARSGAFSNVPGAQAAAQGNQAAAGRHSAAASKAGTVTKALGAEIKGSHDAKASQAADQATGINTTVNGKPGYLDIPPVPGNVG